MDLQPVLNEVAGIELNSTTCKLVKSLVNNQHRPMILEGRETYNVSPISTLAFSLRVFSKLWSPETGAGPRAAVLMGIKHQGLDFRAGKVVAITVIGSKREGAKKRSPKNLHRNLLQVLGQILSCA